MTSYLWLNRSSFLMLKSSFRYFIIFLLISVEINAQDQYASDLEELVIRQWSDEDGLISNNLTSVNQASNGLIWITSFNGIQRFNGKDFTLFTKDNVEDLSTNGFYSTTINESGHLLLASQGSGVLTFKNGKISRIDEIGGASIRKIVVDQSGNYWCGTNNEGVIKYTNTGESISFNDSYFGGTIIWDILELDDGTIWFGTGGKGLVKFDQNEFEQYDLSQFIDDNAVTSIYQIGSEKLALGTTQGLFYFDLKTGSLSHNPILSDITINDLTIGSNKDLWVATERGLFNIGQNNRISKLDESNGLPHNQVSSVILDSEKNIWLTTKKAGLVRLAEGLVRAIGNSQGLASRRVNIVAPGKSEMLIGCDDGEIYSFKNDYLTPTTFGKYLNGTGVRDIAFHNNKILIASYNGLTVVDKNEAKTYGDELPIKTIRRILIRNDNSIWLASKTGGVIEFFDDKEPVVWSKDKGLASNYILALEEDKNGHLVIGTHSGGLSIKTEDDITTHVIPGIESALIFNIYIDSNNVYWLSTNVGIYRFEDGQFSKITIKTPIQTDTFFDFVPDDDQNIWLPSNAGIAKTTWNQINGFIEGQKEYVQADIYNTSDGMINKECTGATRTYIADNGDVWVPTIDGVAIVNAKRLANNTIIPQVSITDFIVDGQNSLDVEKIEPGNLRYQFAFSSSSYTAPDKVSFKYKLSPVQNGWIDTYEREVEYTNLPPGVYSFTVIGSNNSNLWNNEGDTHSFIVLPFYYQTWWFKALIGIMALTLIYFIFIWRVRRVNEMNLKLTKVNEELDKFVYSASHDLRAPLSSILGLAEVARLSDSSEEKDKCLDLIKNSTVKLDLLINDIIEYSRNERLELVYSQFDAEKEIADIIEGLKFTEGSEKVDISISINTPLILTDSRRLRVVLRNLIANAYLYHDYKKAYQFIKVFTHNEEDKVLISVEDNGLGISEQDKKNIFKMFYRAHSDSKGSGLGLYIANENIKKLGGKLSVQSKLGVGSTFTITLSNKK